MSTFEIRSIGIKEPPLDVWRTLKLNANLLELNDSKRELGLIAEPPKGVRYKQRRHLKLSKADEQGAYTSSHKSTLCSPVTPEILNLRRYLREIVKTGTCNDDVEGKKNNETVINSNNSEECGVSQCKRVIQAREQRTCKGGNEKTSDWKDISNTELPSSTKSNIARNYSQKEEINVIEMEETTGDIDLKENTEHRLGCIGSKANHQDEYTVTQETIDEERRTNKKEKNRPLKENKIISMNKSSTRKENAIIENGTALVVSSQSALHREDKDEKPSGNNNNSGMAAKKEVSNLKSIAVKNVEALKTSAECVNSSETQNGNESEINEHFEQKMDPLPVQLQSLDEKISCHEGKNNFTSKQYQKNENSKNGSGKRQLKPKKPSINHNCKGNKLQDFERTCPEEIYMTAPTTMELNEERTEKLKKENIASIRLNSKESQLEDCEHNMHKFTHISMSHNSQEERMHNTKSQNYDDKTKNESVFNGNSKNPIECKRQGTNICHNSNLQTKDSGKVDLAKSQMHKHKNTQIPDETFTFVSKEECNETKPSTSYSKNLKDNIKHDHECIDAESEFSEKTKTAGFKLFENVGRFVSNMFHTVGREEDLELNKTVIATPQGALEAQKISENVEDSLKVHYRDRERHIKPQAVSAATASHNSGRNTDKDNLNCSENAIKATSMYEKDAECLKEKQCLSQRNQIEIRSTKTTSPKSSRTYSKERECNDIKQPNDSTIKKENKIRSKRVELNEPSGETSSKKYEQRNMKDVEKEPQLHSVTQSKLFRNIKEKRVKKANSEKNTLKRMTSTDLFASLIDEMIPSSKNGDNDVKVIIMHSGDDSKLASELVEKLRSNYGMRAASECQISVLKAMSPYSYLKGAMRWADVIVPLITNTWLDDISIRHSPLHSGLTARYCYMLLRNSMSNPFTDIGQVVPAVKEKTNSSYRSYPEFFNAIPIWIQFPKLAETILQVHKLPKLIKEVQEDGLSTDQDNYDATKPTT